MRSWWVSINTCSTSAPHTSTVFYNLNKNTVNFTCMIVFHLEQVKTWKAWKRAFTRHLCSICANPSRLTAPNQISWSPVWAGQQISKILSRRDKLKKIQHILSDLFWPIWGIFGRDIWHIYIRWISRTHFWLTFLAEEEERQNQRSLRFQLFQVDIFDAVNIKSDSNCKF